MDFAKKQLEKYGWQEGKGLGKQEDGISEAVKPTLKFDTTGIGFDHSEQFTNNWWEKAFNKSANNIQVVKSEEGNVCISNEKSSSSDPLNRLKKPRKSTEVKKSILKNGAKTTITLTSKKKKSKINKEVVVKGVSNKSVNPEKLLYRQLRKISLTDKKEKKVVPDRKLKEYIFVGSNLENVNNTTTLKSLGIAMMKEMGLILEQGLSSTSESKNKKDVTTEKKRVSFNNTVTEYVQQDNFDSSSSADGASCSCKIEPDPPQTILSVSVQEASVKDTEVTNYTNSELDAKIKLEYRTMRRTLRKLRKLEKEANSKKSESKARNPFASKKRKMEDSMECDERNAKIQVKDLPSRSNAATLEEKKKKVILLVKEAIPTPNLGTAEDKRRRHELKKQIRFEKKVNNIAKSLGSFNISDNTSD